MKTVWIAAGAALLSLTAPVLAQPMAAGSSIVVTGKHQQDWQRGNTLEAEGLKALEKARKELVKHSADVVDAETKRDVSSQRAANARGQFESLTKVGAASPSAKDSQRWAKQVEEAASAWAKHEERGAEGSKALTKAMKRQSKAQASVDEAQAKVDLGRRLMADAERNSAAES